MTLADSQPWSVPSSFVWGLVCHFPGERRRKRQLLMLKAYIDDSGNDDGPWFVLGGYIATAEAWARFSDDWQAVLDMKPTIKHFKLSEAMRWSDAHWRERMPLFAAAIKKHASAGVSISIPNQLYRRVAAGRKPHSNPYHVAVGSLILELTKYHDQLLLTEPVDFIFDEGNSPIVMNMWDKVRARLPPDVRKLLGRTPIPGDDKTMLPLQAADFYAGFVRRKLINRLDPKKPIMRPIRWPKDTKLKYLDFEMTEIGVHRTLA